MGQSMVIEDYRPTCFSSDITSAQRLGLYLGFGQYRVRQKSSPLKFFAVFSAAV